jgi:eukaryotic-like serine/threonine-protein kinase
MQPQLIAGRYQVLRAIGRGGMGTVWLCRDEILGREVAVKQIGALPGDSASETKRAMREARSAAALNHPNAVAVYDVVDHESRPWLVMEYVEGETLADEILREGRLSPQRVADVGSQLAGALARAHQRLIVHRDIKPGNVLIDKAGHPKISDFGIARGHGDEALTQVGFITGTPGYLSPELARGGDPHPASDVWALGATLYAAVEGQPPYEPRSNPIALLRAIATERPRPMIHAGVLAPAIAAMMHEDPTCRWDMATSARRLGGIARAAALAAPKLDPTATRVIAAPVLDSTQALEPTQRLKAAAPVVAAVVPAAAAAAATAVVKPPVVAEPVVANPVVAKPGVAVPDVAAPVAKPAVVAQPVVAAAVTKPSVVASAPVVAKASVAAARPAPRPVVDEAPVAKAAVVRAPVRKAPGVAGPLAPHGGALAAPPGDKVSRRRWIPLGLVALLVLALGTFLLLSQLDDQGAPTANPAGTGSTAPAKPAVTTAPQVSDPPSATSPEPSRTTAPPASGANAQLESFVASYYANVIQNRDSTWNQLSPRMQGFAGGRSSYDGFWRSIRSVSVNRVRANAAANTAVVNLTFTKTNGTKTTETHNFTFLRNGAGYLIQTDR